MKIKTTMRYYFTPIKMAVMEKNDCITSKIVSFFPQIYNFSVEILNSYCNYSNCFNYRFMSILFKRTD